MSWPEPHRVIVPRQTSDPHVPRGSAVVPHHVLPANGRGGARAMLGRK